MCYIQITLFVIMFILEKMSEPKDKRRKMETSKDPQMWLKWFEELSDNESLADDESASEEVNHTSGSEHMTESEQEASETEDVVEPTESGNDSNRPQNFYIGKDCLTKWRKSHPPTNVRTRAHNIITHLPGPINNARETKTEIDILNLFLDDNVLRIICHSTNIYIENIREKFERDRDARATDIIEIKGFIGLLYLIGSLGNSRKNLRYLWENSKGNGLESCYLTMSEKRFRFILRCLRFDDIRDRVNRQATDKFAPIRKVFELIISNFQKYYSPSEYLTIDEQLLAFRGRCSFKQYIPTKPAKYGVKVFALADSKTAYTINLEPYVGKQPDGPFQRGNSAEETVLRLVEPVQGSNRNITGDNWFTSVPLCRSLLHNKKLTYVGTVRKNKREIPKEFLPDKNRIQASSIFGFQEDMTLVSYCSKKNKAVLLLSTMHHDASIDHTTNEMKKPELLTFYNSTKIGVDLVDQLCGNYDVSRTTRRWPMVLFFDLLNIIGINAACIYNFHHCDKPVKRVDFLQNISWQLIKPQMARRSNILSIPRELRRRAKLLLGEEEAEVDVARRNGSRGRCYYCGRQRDRTSRKWCVKCQRWTCGEHLREVCVNCFEN